ncbi:PH domain-containing protein [Peribacillus sp. NPDC097198]|uniref:PH domain-containing protein n=1 Tax=Peribacillus sp. NPDC097198 TaxID=3364397 RepID=UPI003826F464
MKFQSKKDWWTYPVFFGIIIAVFIPLFTDQDLTSIYIGVPVAGLILWIWFTTYYVIERNSLVVRSAFIHKIIPVHEIKSIRRTLNPLSSPALSLDRLEILYGNGKMVLISPENREKFLEELKKLNPSIVIVLKK